MTASRTAVHLQGVVIALVVIALANSVGRFAHASPVSKIIGNYPSAPIYSFKVSTSGDPSFATASLTRGSDGNIYGSTHFGGVNNGGYIFRLTSDGFPAHLLDFGDSASANVGPLVQGQDGILYGDSPSGLFGFNPATGVGTMFVPAVFLNTLVHGKWDTKSGLIFGTDGNLYGTEVTGNGGIFKVTPSGTVTILYKFPAVSGVGNPVGGLVQAGDGNFYGTTAPLGNFGTIYRITPAGVFTTVHTFANNSEGYYPRSAMVVGTDGVLYGTALMGGQPGEVFSITTSGTFSVLQVFGLVFDHSSLMLASDGNITA